ncbi:MAG: nicotinate (nicotinamide) nucleotide adenylyltransferase [Acidobacteria bacterium]|nr:MAG: nicotinate (nicotinamide) nucleotide adenylyltransferase [Acidobacteriota bacterium]
MRRIAIYGGTFDPVHNGHVEVARQVRQLFELDEVIFVPACVPPHKRNANITSAFHRFAMLALATEVDQRLLASTAELDAPQLPYAVDTVARMKREDERLFFLIGSDSWAEIRTWYEWPRLLTMCDLIVVTRPGYEVDSHNGIDSIDIRGMDKSRVADLLIRETGPRVFLTDAALVAVSATKIRAAVQLGDRESLEAMVPPAVASYIEKYGLYKTE